MTHDPELVQYPQLPDYLQQPINQLFGLEGTPRPADAATLIETPHGIGAAITVSLNSFYDENVRMAYRDNRGAVTIVNHITKRFGGFEGGMQSDCDLFCYGTGIYADSIWQGSMQAVDQRVRAPIEQLSDGSADQYTQRVALEGITSFLRVDADRDCLAPSNLDQEAYWQLYRVGMMGTHRLGPVFTHILQGLIQERYGRFPARD